MDLFLEQPQVNLVSQYEIDEPHKTLRLELKFQYIVVKGGYQFFDLYLITFYHFLLIQCIP